MVRALWEHQEKLVGSVHELDALLDELHRMHPGGGAIMAVIETPSTGDSLAIGLGRERSVLSYVNGAKDPPYFTSVGSEEGSDDVVVFRYMGDWTEIPTGLAPSDETLARSDERVARREPMLSG